MQAPFFCEIMDTSPLQRIILFNQQYALFTHKDRLLVAVSGGADSTALLSLLVRLSHQGHIRDLVCVHFNHQLRDQAHQDQDFVQHLAHTWGIPLINETLPIKAHAKALRCSVETAGRRWRLERLVNLAQTQGCTAIATGHHQDDNVETLIHRLSRGTGFRGLCGIRPVRVHQDIRFISPLLALTRNDIVKYLRTHHQTWCEDATNQDQAFTRNYIRQALLPAMSRPCPRLTDKLRTLSQSCLAMYTQRIEPRVNALFNAHVRVSTGHISVHVEAVTQESTLVLAELIRQILCHLHVPLQAVTQCHYKALINLIQGHETPVNLPGHVTVTLDQGQAQFSVSHSEPKPPRDAVELQIPGLTQFGDLCFQTRLIKVSRSDPAQRLNPCIEHFDLNRVNRPLLIRERIPGDRFVPLGKQAHQKVGKFLNRARIIAQQRAHVAILSDASQRILWVCPVRISEIGKMTDKTEEVLEISVRLPKTEYGRTTAKSC